MKFLTALALVVVMATPAGAYRTEVDQQVQQQRHERLVKWHRWQDILERRERRAAREAAQEAAAAPSTPSAPPSTFGWLSAEQVASYARGAGFPESVVPTMVAIAARESGYNPNAVNPTSGACGLWQLYPCPGSHAFNPATNAALAYQKYAAAGLSPWGY